MESAFSFLSHPVSTMLQYAVSVLLLGLLLFVYFRRKGLKNLPPGPASLPLIGHLHLFSSKLPPHQTLYHLSRTYGGYMWLKFGSHSTLVISSPEAAKDVLKTNDLTFASRPPTAYTETMTYNGKDLVFAPYGQHWRHMRKVCTMEMFTPKRIDFLRPVRSAEMRNCLKDLAEASKKREVVNISRAAFKLTFNITFKMIMGKKKYSSGTRKHVESDPISIFWILFMETKKASSHFHISDCFPLLKWLDFSIPAMKQLSKKVDEFLQQELDEHKRSFENAHPEDLMDVLISTCDDDTTIKAVTFTTLVAGIETCTATLEWAMAELVRHPQALKELQKELLSVIPPSAGEDLVTDDYVSRLPYLHAVIKETLRLHPPGPLLLPHQSVNDCILEAGYRIPKGTQTLVNAYAIGRDESIWKDPLEFNPERMMNVATDNVTSLQLGNSFELLAFGVGRRMCPGMNLGLTTVHFMLANLVHKFGWETVEPVDVEETTALILEKANHLNLIPLRR